MIIRRINDDGHHHRPAMFREIERFGGTLYHHERGLGHPIALASTSWRAVERALDRALNDYRALLTQHCRPGSQGYAVALDSYASLIGRVVEFAETAAENVASCFVRPGDEVRVAKVQRDRRHVAMICNALKHNQNFLAPVTGTTNDGRVAFGFSVYSVDAKGLQRPNLNIHKRAEAFSLAMEIRRAIATSYVIGERVGDFIASHGAVAANAPLAASVSDANLLSLLERVSRLPIICLPFEKGDIPSVDVDRTEVTIRTSGGSAQRLSGQIRMSVSATPYTGALSIKMPL